MMELPKSDTWGDSPVELKQRQSDVCDDPKQEQVIEDKIEEKQEEPEHIEKPVEEF